MQRFSFATVMAICFGGVLAVMPAFAVEDAGAQYVPLANAVRKLKANKSLRVAIVGDSIGWGQGAGTAEIMGVTYGLRVCFNKDGMPKGNPMGYARTTTDYIKKIAAEKYGVADKNIETFYSVWGGATAFSAFGYFCSDIVSRRPDLLVMQIWNPGKGPEEAVRYTESALRVLWKTCPETDVILVSVGGCFERPNVWKPLTERYHVTYINAIGNMISRLGKFGVRSYSGEHYLDPSGKVSGSCEFVFCHSAPHVCEEGYSVWNEVITSRLDGLFEAASNASGKCETVAPAGSMESAPLNEKGDVCLASSVIAPKDISFTEGEWKISAKELVDEPRDTMDRANSDCLVALKDCVTAKIKVNGLFLWIRGSRDVKLSVDGGKTFVTPKDGFEIRLGDKEDVDAEVLIQAGKKGASINEFYLYGKNFKEVPAKASKHRWSVRYFARVEDRFVHDWHLLGEQVLPHPLVWLNVFRDERYSGEFVVPDDKVLHSDCLRNGTFLGWVEPDEIQWVGGERRMVVKTNDGKKLYRAGEKIDVSKMDRDLTLVAAFANGPVSTDYTRTVKASFVKENKAGAKTVALLDAPAANPVVTLPALPTQRFRKAKGWRKVLGGKVYQSGEKVNLGNEDALFEVAWEYDFSSAAGIVQDGSRTVVDYTVCCPNLEELYSSTMDHSRTGSFDGKTADGKLIYKGNTHTLYISKADGLRIEATKQNAFWKHPTFFGMMPVPVKRSELKKITVAYSYAPKGKTNLVGQHMSLEVYWESADGFKTESVRVKSVEGIAIGENQSVTFEIPPAANDNLICGVALKFYEVVDNPRLWRPQGNIAFSDGDAMIIGRFTFEK